MDLLTSLIYVCWQPHNMENKSCILLVYFILQIENFLIIIQK